MVQNFSGGDVLNETKFIKFLFRGSPPEDYEAQLLREQPQRVKAILEGKTVPPYELEIQPTAKCNLRCKHCFGRDYCRLNDKIGFEEMKVIAQRIDEFRENGFSIDIVKFCGATGEPLLNPVTADSIPVFKKMGKKVIVFSNGVNLDRMDSSGRSYYEHVAGADKFNLSLDAGSRKTFFRLKGKDEFKRIISNLEKLVNVKGKNGNRVNIVVSYIIGRENYLETAKTAALVKDVGANEMRYRVDFTDADGIEMIAPQIIEQLGKADRLKDERFRVVSVYSPGEIRDWEGVFDSGGRRCFNHHFWASIGPDCELYACGHRTHGGVKSYGNVLDHSLKELWMSDERINAVNCLPDEHCKTCSPSSTRRNEFMTFLAGLDGEVRQELMGRYTTSLSS